MHRRQHVEERAVRVAHEVDPLTGELPPGEELPREKERAEDGRREEPSAKAQGLPNRVTGDSR